MKQRRVATATAAVAHMEQNSLEFDDGAMGAALDEMEVAGSGEQVEEEMDEEEVAEAPVSFGTLPIR